MEKWIKDFDIEKCVSLTQYSQASEFQKVADVLLETSSKRKTVIQFVNTISKKEWDDKTEWLYLFVVDSRVVKIGGTRAGLKDRCASYLCGHQD